MTGSPGAWAELTFALTFFLATHAIPARPTVRKGLVTVLGRRLYLAGYSAVSILALAWLIKATADAPFVELWPREDWQSLVPAMAMPLALILIVFGLSTPNPLSLGPKGGAFDPDHPGIAGFVRHPILCAMLIWSGSHMVPNGDISHVVMFGLFATLSAAGMPMLDRRFRRRLGDAAWSQLSARTSNIPLASLLKGWRPCPNRGIAARVVLGLALYGVLVAAHGLMAGLPLL